MASIPSVGSYPFKLPEFGNGQKVVVLENKYLLRYGKVIDSTNGKPMLAATITKKNFPQTTVAEKKNLTIYKTTDPEPSATFTLSDPAKTLYVFMSNTTPYIHDQKTLDSSISGSFDSGEVSFDETLITNYGNIYDVLAECGAFFEVGRKYRQYAIVKSGKDGKLYVKKSPGEIAGAKDPSADPQNWVLFLEQDQSMDPSLFVTLAKNETITGEKTFSKAPLITDSTTAGNLLANQALTKGKADELYVSQSTGTAANARKLNNLDGRDKRDLDTKQVVVLTDPKTGLIDSSFLGSKLIYSKTEIFVDPSKPNGETIFATVQEAYDSATQYVRGAQVVINVADGTYPVTGAGRNAVLKIDETYDNSRIAIIGNINNPGNCRFSIKAGQHGIDYIGSGLVVMGIHIDQFESEPGDSIGVNVSEGSSLVLNNVTTSKCGIALKATGRSYVKAASFQDVGSLTSVSAEASVIQIDGAKITDCQGIGVEAKYNSLIYAKGAKIDKKIDKSGTVGFRCSYNSTILAKETSSLGSTVDSLHDGATTDVPNSTGGIISFS